MLAAFSSCKKDQLLVSPKTNLENNLVALKVEKDYLEFRDQKAMDSVVRILLSMTPQKLDEWENGLNGFKSYRTIFKEIQADYNNVNDQQAFTNFSKKYGGLVQITADSSITYKLGTPLSSYFINKDGHVKVGDEFREYTADNKILVYKGDFGNVSSVKTYSFKKDKGNQISVSGPFSTGIVSQALYYNSDNQRRLHVQFWYEQLTPNPPGPERGTGRFYFIVLQELKRTFGGWRANNTNYYQNSINWNWTLVDSPLAPIYEGYVGGSISYPNTTGPIFFGMGDFLGTPSQTSGSASFTTGGVPTTPTFNVY